MLLHFRFTIGLIYNIHLDTKSTGPLGNSKANGAQAHNAHVATVQAFRCSILLLVPLARSQVNYVIGNIAVDSYQQANDQFSDRYGIFSGHVTNRNLTSCSGFLVNRVGSSACANHKAQRRRSGDCVTGDPGASNNQHFGIANCLYQGVTIQVRLRNTVVTLLAQLCHSRIWKLIGKKNLQNTSGSYFASIRLLFRVILRSPSDIEYSPGVQICVKGGKCHS